MKKMFGEPGPSRHVFGRRESPINPLIAPDQTRMVCGLHVTYSCVVTLFFSKSLIKMAIFVKKIKIKRQFLLYFWVDMSREKIISILHIRKPVSGGWFSLNLISGFK